MRIRTVSDAPRLLLALGAAVALIACGDRQKSPDAKAAVLSAPTSTKSGPSDMILVGQALTAAVSGGIEKASSMSDGQTLSGRLEPGDATLDDGAYFEGFTFSVEGRRPISITMTSDDFDTYMLLLDNETAEVIAENDDAEGTNSRIDMTLEAGTYAIMATTYGVGGTGDFEVTILDGDAGTLSPGGSVSGSLVSGGETLGDGSYFEDWPISGRSGDRVTLTLSSSDFDAYLMLIQDGEIIASNDDGAGGTDSQITVTLPSTGSYTVRANSYGAGATGSYSLSMESGAATGFSGFGSGGDPNGRYALVVGIDDYPGTANDLRGPIEDARVMQRVLVDKYGFDPANIVTLDDSDATRANIAQGIVQHLGQAGPDGVAVFFYSGHGTQIGENIGLTGALDPEPRGEGDEAIYIYGYDSESSVLLDEELGYLVESIDAGRVLVVVDACFSGEITRGSADSPQSKVVDLSDPAVAQSVQLPSNFITSELKSLDLSDMSLGFGDFGDFARVFQNPLRHIMWGGSTEDQVSWTSSLGNGTSVFTYYIGQRMMDAPGTMTFRQLNQQVHDDVVGYIESDGNMTMQDPQMRGDNQDITLEAFFRQR